MFTARHRPGPRATGTATPPDEAPEPSRQTFEPLFGPVTTVPAAAASEADDRAESDLQRDPAQREPAVQRDPAQREPAVQHDPAQREPAVQHDRDPWQEPAVRPDPAVHDIGTPFAPSPTARGEEHAGAPGAPTVADTPTASQPPATIDVPAAAEASSPAEARPDPVAREGAETPPEPPEDLRDLAVELERLAYGEDDEPPAAPEAEPVVGPGSSVRVYGERLDRRPGPIRMSPSEALALAKEGREALQRGRSQR